MSSEIVKANEVMARTLFVGVGGIGGSIVSKVAGKCRPGETENVNFVCMDTNTNDLRQVMDSRQEIYYVQTSSTQTVGDYLSYDKDAMDNWFPKNNVLYNKTVSEGAGQVRAISRLALNATVKNGNITPLLSAVDNLFRKDGEELQQALRIVFVSSASGGTGSGMILPLTMYLRNYVESKYPNTGVIVRTLLLLPETLDNEITSNREKENQRRNAYATVKELNAFMMKGTGIFDTDPFLSKYKDLHLDFTSSGTDQLQRLDCLPCDFCFLLDGQNTEDSTLVNLKQYIEQAAQALYEQNIGPMQKKAFSVEDNVIREFTSPGNFARNRFGGIGASTLCYPYEEIADFVAYGWAIESIGGEVEAAKWSRYDKIFEAKLRKAKSEGVPIEEYPKLNEVYISSLISGTDKFSKSLIKLYDLNSVKNDRLSIYAADLEEYLIQSCMRDDPVMAGIIQSTERLEKNIDYTQEKNRKKAARDLQSLRRYESMVGDVLKKSAQYKAESIFKNEAKSIMPSESYMIESLIKRPDGVVYHPNAIRYVLYSLEIMMKDNLESLYNEVKAAKDELLQYSSAGQDRGNRFDVGEDHYPTMQALVNAESKYSDWKDKVTQKDDKYYAVLGTHLKKMYQTITSLAENTIKYEAYSIGYEQVQALIASFENFYHSFSNKVVLLEKRREDIIEELKFRKGDSILNICSADKVLRELEKVSVRKDTEGTMLDSELCGEMFDAVKANAKFEEEIKYLDVVEDDRRIDVFDSIVLDYFREDVRRNVETLDMNIIEAIVKENRLKRRILKREAMGDSKEKIFDQVSPDEDRRYIDKILTRGRNLAAPGIQPVEFDEKREINLSAYNKSLDGMRGFRMDELLNGGISTDTISSREIHFFRALYDLTPDAIDKFACEKFNDSIKTPAGLYHKAYIDYSKLLGPDSTKELQISTHIDKRWDSVAYMPELDMQYLKNQIMKIQQAVIYAFVYDSIIYKNISEESGSRKEYVYMDMNENDVKLVTPNSSDCDQFYEVLDAFYINPMMVSEVETLKEKYQRADKASNKDYDESTLKKELDEFYVECFHTGKTSLFEIPLMYYNTLPNTLRSRDEWKSIIDAVIQTFLDEISLLEMENNIKMVMGNILYKHFVLLLENYKLYPSLNEGIEIKENNVLDVIFRKVKKYITDEAQPTNVDEKIANMKELMER